MPVKLVGQLVARPDLVDADRRALFTLFAEHFIGVTLERFQQDLDTKNWVILLRDADTGELQGFSTLALYTTTFKNKPLSVVYSGDTIIRPAFWGTPALPSTWIKSVLNLSLEMPQPLYWLLISSGYKTYRFLTVFYKEFYPRYDQATPPEMQGLLDQLAQERFGADYDPAQGIVRFANGATPLRPGIAEVSEERLSDPHVQFFLKRNAGHAQGDELVCLTRIHPDNFTAAGRRMAR